MASPEMKYIQLTDEEIQEVDSMMADHMYGHAISNSYHNFSCNAQCRKDALGYAINKVLKEKQSGEL